MDCFGPVSYTHLDVYKRQVLTNALLDQNSRISKYRQRIERAIRETLVQDFSCLQNFRNGFISSDECSESVSKTIENSVDFGALKLVSPSDERIVENTFYKNLFNPKTGFFQAKLNHTLSLIHIFVSLVGSSNMELLALNCLIYFSTYEFEIFL